MFKKLKYLFKCIIYMDYKSLFQTVKTVHKICGKNSIILFFDIIFCGLKYGAGYKDYLLCEFYNLTSAQRATYLTRGINNAITRRLCHPDYYHIFTDKEVFCEKFAKFIKRDWLFMPHATEEEFVKFMENKDVVIIKPNSESCGVGVEKLKKSDYKDVHEMYQYIASLPDRMVEELIIQHDELNALNPYSVNTLRIVTVFADGAPHIVYAVIRIGNGKRPVDNINAGGMCAPIDIETGIITHVGYDKERISYEKHPITNQQIAGTKIPMWDKAVEMVLECGKVVPEIGYTGWDVGMTPNGPLIVEGNHLPGHDAVQLPPHVPDKIGMLPQYKKYIKNI